MLLAVGAAASCLNFVSAEPYFWPAASVPAASASVSRLASPRGLFLGPAHARIRQGDASPGRGFVALARIVGAWGHGSDSIRLTGCVFLPPDAGTPECGLCDCL
jgi:hypothetical protein